MCVCVGVYEIDTLFIRLLFLHRIKKNYKNNRINWSIIERAFLNALNQIYLTLFLYKCILH